MKKLLLVAVVGLASLAFSAQAQFFGLSIGGPCGGFSLGIGGPVCAAAPAVVPAPIVGYAPPVTYAPCYPPVVYGAPYYGWGRAYPYSRGYWGGYRGYGYGGWHGYYGRGWGGYGGHWHR
jgi:hypothetical protein